MATIEKFEDILIWQKAHIFSTDIYKLMKENRDYSFRDQMQRAVVSIMNNIAEGFERRGNKEFRQFLFIAKGSCGEVRSMLYLARDLEYINQSSFENLMERALEISRMLSGLIKKL